MCGTLLFLCCYLPAMSMLCYQHVQIRRVVAQCTLVSRLFSFFFFNDTAPTEISPLSLHDALPIWRHSRRDSWVLELVAAGRRLIYKVQRPRPGQSAVPELRARREHELLVRLDASMGPRTGPADRKSTRLNSSH